jgi:hypothetical protein
MMFPITRFGRRRICRSASKLQRQTLLAMGIQEFKNKNLVHVAPIDARA